MLQGGLRTLERCAELIPFQIAKRRHMASLIFVDIFALNFRAAKPTETRLISKMDETTVETSNSTTVESNDVLKAASVDELDVDQYSSKAQNKTSFSDYLVKFPTDPDSASH
jgi:hypothetical protein